MGPTWICNLTIDPVPDTRDSSRQHIIAQRNAAAGTNPELKEISACQLRTWFAALNGTSKTCVTHPILTKGKKLQRVIWAQERLQELEAHYLAGVALRLIEEVATTPGNKEEEEFTNSF
jgi:hypothetical protein